MKNPLSQKMTILLLSSAVGIGGAGVAGSSFLSQFSQSQINEAKSQPAASQEQVINQFLDEKEGNRLKAYRDGKGIWTICRGVTRIDGKPVRGGMVVNQSFCDVVNSQEADKSIAWVRKNVPVKLNIIQEVGIASFCPYNLGADKCRYTNGRKTRFWSYIERGDIKNACKHIPDWIFDNGKDCRIKSNGCLGQVNRRQQEEYLCLYQMGEAQ